MSDINLVVNGIASRCYPFGGTMVPMGDSNIRDIMNDAQSLAARNFPYFYVAVEDGELGLLFNPEIMKRELGSVLYGE